MPAGIQPRKQRIDLVDLEFQRALGLEVNRVEAFECDRIIREDGRLKTRDDRLHLRLVRSHLRQDRQRSRNCRGHWNLMWTRLAHAQVYLLGAHTSLFIEQASVPSADITARRERRDRESLRRAGG